MKYINKNYFKFQVDREPELVQLGETLKFYFFIKILLFLYRAIYSNADIYLLDDPLAAVNPTVAK